MVPSRELEDWLKEAGYEHYCFISYPRVEGSAVMDLARAFANAIRTELKNFTEDWDKRVFIDEDIAGGEVWEERLRVALCRSVVMVAVCAPIYYSKSHRWCGREYQGMLALKARRLPESPTGTILPMIVRKGRDPLPLPITSVQYCDLEKETTRGGFHRTRKFRSLTFDILERVDSVAAELRERNAVAGCAGDEFPLPDRSAFEDYDVRQQAAPLRST
jgi:hypothetical protein